MLGHLDVEEREAQMNAIQQKEAPVDDARLEGMGRPRRNES